MTSEAAAIARLGAALSNEARAGILCALMAGTSHTNTELGRFVGLAPSSISEHIATLADAGLVTIHRQGRHRYVSIADAQVAQLLEDLGVRASSAPVHPRAPSALLGARSCYQHLAGRLGVAVYDSLRANGSLVSTNGDIGLSASGLAQFASLGIDVPAGKTHGRSCMDWTERRPHLAGPPADALLNRALKAHWLRRHHCHPRALELTALGRSVFTNSLGIELP